MASEYDYRQHVEALLDQTKRQLLERLAHSQQEYERNAYTLLLQEPHSDWIAKLREYTGPHYREDIDKLERLEAAQCQFDLGLYGICNDCEEPIEKHRLAQDISAQRCEKCEALFNARQQTGKT